MPAPPMYRPGERIDGPQADTSAVRQYIVRLRGMTDVGRENSLSALISANYTILVGIWR